MKGKVIKIIYHGKLGGTIAELKEKKNPENLKGINFKKINRGIKVIKMWGLKSINDL